MRKELVVVALGFAVMILNPYYVNPLKSKFSYSAAEMKAAIEGTWTLTLDDRSYIFHIQQADRDWMPQVSERAMRLSSCTHRTLVASAAACRDITRMPVVVTLSGENTDGLFAISSTTLVEGELWIEVDGRKIYAIVMPDGTAAVDGAKLIRTAR